MGYPVNINFELKQGATFSKILRWEVPPIIYKTITAVQKSAPCRLEVPGHGLVNGWRAAISNVNGMKEINAKNEPPLMDEYFKITVLDDDNIEINNLNSLGFSGYTGGGIIRYNTPVDLTGFTARLQLRPKLKSPDVIAEMTTENGRIVLDNATKTIMLVFDAEFTAGMNFKQAVYDLEMVSAGGQVTPLATGVFTFTGEATHT